MIHLPQTDFLMILNEEGKLNNLLDNLLQPGDVIVTIVFVGNDGEEFRGLLMRK